MSGSPQPTPQHDHSPPRTPALARRPASPIAPIAPILPAGIDRPGTNVPFLHPPQPAPASNFSKDRAPKNGVLRGLKDLQQLQRQTLAVLESVRGSLDDIQQVLRSPEATRGMEKQKNAATLLAKGFPRDATEQAAGAVNLLPANPDAHLLLALSLAADQQFDAALAATRKGLALIDRRAHPLAIEAGLLHTLAALGNSPEAVERWAAIIDALPLPVLLEQTGRIAACFPAGDTVDPPDAADAQTPPAGGAHLDILLSTRLTHAAQSAGDFPEPPPRRQRLIDTAPGEIPASSLFAGLDAAEDAGLSLTRRAILGQVAHRLRSIGSAADVLRFLTECVVPLGNRNALRTTASLARTAVKRLYFFQADAPTLFRAMGKLEMAGALASARELATLLFAWRKAGKRATRARRALIAALGFFLAGSVFLAWILWRSTAGAASLAGLGVNPITIGAAMMAVGVCLGLFAVLTPGGDVVLPDGRPALSPDELHFLRNAGVGHSLRALMTAAR